MGEVHVLVYFGTDKKSAQKLLVDFKKSFAAAQLIELESVESRMLDTFNSPIVAEITVLGLFLDYKQAVERALELSRLSQTNYSSRGLVFKDGRLRWPENVSSPQSNAYWMRARNDCTSVSPCISVERSEGYAHYKAGSFLVVGAVNELQRLESYKKVAPEAENIKTALNLISFD
jgi:hypothetical protein